MKKKWLFVTLLLCALLALLPAAVFAAEITLEDVAEEEADLTAIDASEETPVQAASKAPADRRA